MEAYRGIVLFLLVSVLSFRAAFAETVVLKSGQTVEGKIVEKTDSYIKIEFEGIPLTFFTNEIERIDEGSASIVVSGQNIANQQEAIVPESAPVTEQPSDDLSVIGKINSSYYDPKRQGLDHFRCEVTSSVFDKMKKKYSVQGSVSSSENKVLNSLKFYLVFPQDLRFGFDVTPFSPTGNAQFNADLQLAINEVRDSAIPFSNWVWLRSIERILGRDASEYTLERVPDGYCVSYSREDNSHKICVDSKFLPTHAIMIEKEGTFNQSFYFMSSSQGPLLQRYDELSNNGAEKYAATLEYQEVEGLQMPKHALIQETKSGTTLNFELHFSNFEINK